MKPSDDLICIMEIIVNVFSDWEMYRAEYIRIRLVRLSNTVSADTFCALGDRRHRRETADSDAKLSE